MNYRMKGGGVAYIWLLGMVLGCLLMGTFAHLVSWVISPTNGTKTVQSVDSIGVCPGIEERAPTSELKALRVVIVDNCWLVCVAIIAEMKGDGALLDVFDAICMEQLINSV